MQVAQPTPDVEPTGTGTMEFPKLEHEDPGTGTMQFARPINTPPPIAPIRTPPPVASMRPINTPPPIAPAAGSGSTMQFALPRDLPAEPQGTGTMQFARPAATAPAPEPDIDIAEGEWDAISSPSAVFAMPALPTVQTVPVPPPANPYDLPPPGPPPSEPKFAPNATSAWDQRSNPGIRISDIAPGLGKALDLVAADRPHASSPSGVHKLDEVKTLMRGAKDLLGLDDHSGAMDLILKAQEIAPNDAEVQALRERSERTLEAMFESKLGKLTAAPRVKLKDDEIIWLNLDHRAGFVLAQIDGQVTFEDLFSVSGMSRLDTARILAQLIEEGVIIR
jgi:hypothetical protein